MCGADGARAAAATESHEALLCRPRAVDGATGVSRGARSCRTGAHPRRGISPQARGNVLILGPRSLKSATQPPGPPPGRTAPSPPQGPCPPSSSPVPSSPTVPCGSPAHLDLSGAPNAVAAGGHVWSTFGKPTGRSLSTARARGGGAATRVWAPVRPTPGRVTRHCHCPSRSADSDPPEGAQEAPAGRGEAAPRGPRRGGPHARRRRARRGGGRAVARARERSRREAQGAGGQLRRRPAR